MILRERYMLAMGFEPFGLKMARCAQRVYPTKLQHTPRAHPRQSPVRQL